MVLLATLSLLLSSSCKPSSACRHCAVFFLKVHFITVHGKYSRTTRQPIWIALEAIARDMDAPWMVGGILTPLLQPTNGGEGQILGGVIWRISRT